MSTARAILAGGLVSLDLWDTVAQAYTGFGSPLDADKFEIVPQSEKKTSQSRSHLDYGQARASVVVPQPTQINIDLSAASVAAFAMQFQGLVQSLTQASGTWTDAEIVVGTHGVWQPLGKRNVSDTGFTVTNAGGATTYVLGTHYQVNWQRGEIRFLDVSGAPAEGATVEVSGTYNAVDGKKILGGRVTQVRARARWDGRNLVNTEVLEVNVHECVLGTGSGFDFLGADFTAIELNGEIVTPPGFEEGYEIVLPQRSGEYAAPAQKARPPAGFLLGAPTPGRPTKSPLNPLPPALRTALPLHGHHQPAHPLRP